MFNMRPSALSPWIYVEPPQPESTPGFRLAPDGPVRDTQSTALSPFGSDPFAGTAPSAVTGIADVIRLAMGSQPYGTAFAPELSSFSQDSFRQAFDRVAKVDGRDGSDPSALFSQQGAYAGDVSPADSWPSSRLPPRPALPPAAQPAAPHMPVRYVKSDGARESNRPVDVPLGNPDGFASRQDLPWPQSAPQTSSYSDTFGARRYADGDVDPYLSSVGDVKDNAPGGDNLIAQARQDDKDVPAPHEKVEGPLDALGHYIWGSGKTVEYSFDRIETDKVTPMQFPSVENIIRRGQPGTYKVVGKMPFSAPNFKSEYLVGNITLNIDGTLVLDEEGNYSFKGELGAEPDRYRFYSSNHRATLPEIATRLGELLPGREFTVVINGRKPIVAQGKYR